ncbi:MAG: sulfopyruvate decarboxylase, partial [Nitrospirae bacterium]
TPIGLGLSLRISRKIFVIDGDGSLLMNPGCLATIAAFNPKNLIILAVDNGVYGSTGNQPTYTFDQVDLSLLARAMGIQDVFHVDCPSALDSAIASPSKGVKFIHIIAKAGNEPVPEIPLKAVDIKERFQRALMS